jgi:hypothetical protein
LRNPFAAYALELKWIIFYTLPLHWLLRWKNDIAESMKIAYLHYHLKTGGVTPVKQKIDKTVLVSSFLNLDEFSLLKWSDYTEEK